MKCTAALAVALSLVAQESRFDVESRLVLVPVTVTDSKGRFVDGLEASDFLVLDDGCEREVTVDSFATGVAPVALAIAVQSSGISTAALIKVKKIGAMIQPLITGERGCAALVAFAERIEWLQECTGDPEALSLAFQRLEPGEEKTARTLDAVNQAIERLRKRPRARRVLLVIAESRDRGSETDLDSAVVAAQTAGVAIYAATYSALKTAFMTRPSDVARAPEPKGTPPPGREPESPAGREIIPIAPPEERVDIAGGIGEVVRLGKTKTTDVLAKMTGGTTFSFTRQKGLEDAIQKLGAELHGQYLVSFAPEARSPGYHRLEVRVARRGDFRLRARPGYWGR